MGDEAMKISLLTIGDSQVGKSSLLLRFTSDNGKFNPQSMPTIGIDFKMKSLELEGTRIKLQIWDTAGQERFRTITNSYYRKVQGILLVYDITDKNSFQNIRQWMEQIQAHADTNVNKILIGNKFDLAQKRVVTHDEGVSLSKEFKIPFFETSAINNLNVDQAFMTLVQDIKIRMEIEGKDKSRPVKDDSNRKLPRSTTKKLTEKKKAQSSWC